MRKFHKEFKLPYETAGIKGHVKNSWTDIDYYSSTDTQTRANKNMLGYKFTIIHYVHCEYNNLHKQTNAQKG